MGSVINQGQLPKEYPPLTIINNINTEKPAKADNNKESSKEYLPGRILYTGLEIAFIHREFLNRCVTGQADPVYRLTYLTSMIAGAAFGLYKAIKTQEEPGLEMRAEAFAKKDNTAKGIMLAEMYILGPLALVGAENFKGVSSQGESSQGESSQGKSSLGNLVAMGWGFSLGSDIAKYVYHNIVSKK